MISLAAEIALDDARATHAEAMGYSEALDRFRGEVTDETREIRRAARTLLTAAEREARQVAALSRELAEYAKSLGFPRAVHVAEERAPRWDPRTPACPVWLERELGMGMHPSYRAAPRR